MVIKNNETAIDNTMTYLMIGIIAILFMFFTIVGMKRVEATAEQAKKGQPQELKEVQIDISGETD